MVDKYGATEVRYMYEGETQQIVEDANRYNISVEYIDVTIWHASGKVIDYRTNEITGFISHPVTEKNPSITELDSDFYNKRTTYYYLSNDFYNGGYAPLNNYLLNWEGNYFETGIRYVDNWWENQDYILTYKPRILINRATSSPYIVKQVLNLWTQEITPIHSQPQITYWIPADGIPVWTLHIYQDDTEVFSRTEVNKLPIQLFVKTLECRTNTCPVDCGTHICCYGSDGIATEYFTK